MISNSIFQKTKQNFCLVKNLSFSTRIGTVMKRSLFIKPSLLGQLRRVIAVMSSFSAVFFGTKLI